MPAALPASMDFNIQAMFFPRSLMVCRPSLSFLTSSGVNPWVMFHSKRVEVLGKKTPLPVEVLKFGHLKTKYALEKQGCKANLRMTGGTPFITDSGNYIYDCKFESISNPFFLESRIDVIPGVVENGLFLNTATTVLIASGDGGIERLGE